MIRVLRDLRALPIRRILIRRKDIYRATSIRPTDNWLSFEGLIILLVGGYKEITEELWCERIIYSSEFRGSSRAMLSLYLNHRGSSRAMLSPNYLFQETIKRFLKSYSVRD